MYFLKGQGLLHVLPNGTRLQGVLHHQKSKHIKGIWVFDPSLYNIHLVFIQSQTLENTMCPYLTEGHNKDTD